MTLPEPRASGAWRRYLRVQYRLIRLLGPLVGPYWRAFGLGNIVELRVVGRRTGRPRRILLGLLQAGGHWFLGHPNGDTAWTRNLEAGGTAELSLSWPLAIPIRATRLPYGLLRDQAILATSQHVFPGNIVYRLARRHVRAVGTYFLIEIAPREETSASGAPPAKLARGGT